MGTASASIDVAGRAADAEALWYDPVRRPAWVDGLAHVSDVSAEWPESGRMLWTSRPGGRGRVLEEVLSYEPRVGQTLAVEDERLRGIQRVAFAPGPEHVTVTVELEYELKQRAPLVVLYDLLLVRRQISASLRRSLERFARERRGDMELEAEVGR